MRGIEDPGSARFGGNPDTVELAAAPVHYRTLVGIGTRRAATLTGRWLMVSYS
jgi:hypothetical protein